MRAQQFLRGFKEGMHNFGKTLSLVISSALLAVVYFIGVGLTSVLAKLFRKHFLIGTSTRTPIGTSKEGSYWSELNLRKKPMRDYYRQF